MVAISKFIESAVCKLEEFLRRQLDIIIIIIIIIIISKGKVSPVHAVKAYRGS
jgi:hypothetical protein